MKFFTMLHAIDAYKHSLFKGIRGLALRIPIKEKKS